MSLRLAVLAITSLLAASSLSAQTTIDFQDVASGSCAPLGPSVVSRGFQFTGNPADPGLFACNAGVLQGNTSAALLNANSRSILTMARVGGGTFSLNSFFAGGRREFETFPFTVASGIDILGNVSGGGVVNASVLLGMTEPYAWSQFVLSPDFSNLTSVVFTAQGDGDSPEFLIDDIVVDARAVPEPASLLLLVSGLLALGVYARRRLAR